MNLMTRFKSAPTSSVLPAHTSPLVGWALLLDLLVICAFGLLIAHEKNALIAKAESELRGICAAAAPDLAVAFARTRLALEVLADDLKSAHTAQAINVGERQGELHQRSQPWLRSLSVVSSSGLVLASTRADNMGYTLSLAALGELAPPNTPAMVARMQSGQDIADLRPASADPSTARLLPMLRATALWNGETVYLLALIDPNYFAAQFKPLLGESATRLSLLGHAGDLIASTDPAPLPSMDWLKASAVLHPSRISQPLIHNPSHGMGDAQTMAACQAMADLPLVIIAQQPSSRVMQSFWPIAALIGVCCLGILGLTWAGVLAVLRSARLRIQDQLQLQKALASAAQSSAFHEAIRSIALDAIITIDAQDQVLTFNAAAEQMFGYQASFAVGKNISELIVPEDLREYHQHGVKNFVHTQLSSVINQRRQTIAQRADGTQFPIEISVVSLNIANNPCFIGTIRDISAIKNDEAERLDLLIDYGNVAREMKLVNAELAEVKQRELEIGTQIQQTMLVNSVALPHTGLWSASFSQASKGIDGDFFDVMQVNDFTFDVLAGDVMGKGVPAALLGAATKLQFNRSMAALLLGDRNRLTLPQPAAIVSHVHQAMAPQLQALEAFVTLVYIRIDLQGNAVTWVGCGHEETLLMGAGQHRCRLQNKHPPLGVLLNEVFEQSEHHFGATDALFLASDGASDALTGDGQQVGRDVLHDCIERQLSLHHTPGMALHTLRRNLLTYHVSLTDDLTLALFCRYERQRDVIRIQIPIQLSALVAVREFIAERTFKAGLDEAQCATVAVALVEVVTNVIRHATGLLAHAPMELFGEIENKVLTTECKYLGDYFKPQEISKTAFSELSECGIRSLPEGGFGLGIIYQVADEVHYLHEDGVNTVRLLFGKQQSA